MSQSFRLLRLSNLSVIFFACSCKGVNEFLPTCPKITQPSLSPYLRQLTHLLRPPFPTVLPAGHAPDDVMTVPLTSRQVVEKYLANTGQNISLHKGGGGLMDNDNNAETEPVENGHV